MPPSKLGPYKIGRQLGRGGMGAVYEGLDHEQDLRVAVKVLATSLADHPDFRERFEVEIETLRKLRHPNIVRIYGFGEQDGHLFYAMEMVEGQSLEELLRADKRFDWREVTDLGVKLARALKHAHDRGVIHRDIKPANLLLAGDGVIKLTDFGIAKLFGMSGLTGVGGVVGTAEYMSPEQTMGRRITERSDLYSLGGVMYALLAGRPPFIADSVPEMLQLQRFAEPGPVRVYAPDVPRELEEIIRDLLAKEPEKRVPNAMMLARRLEATVLGLARSAQHESVADSDDPQTAADVDSAEVRPVEATFDPIAETQAAPPPPPEEHESNELVDPWTATIASTEYELPEPVATSAVSATAARGEPVEAPAPAAAAPRKADHFTPVDEHEGLSPHEQASTHYLRLAAQIAVLVVALATLSWGLWYAMRPPTADELYREIGVQMESDDVEQMLGAEGDIRQFLATFPNDPRRDELQSHREEIELERLERQFNRRARRLESGGSLSTVERAYLEAVRYEQLDPDLGRAKLQALVDLFSAEEASSEKTRACLELARRRLARLDERAESSAADQLADLKRQLDHADAIRQQDPARARAIWNAVVELYGQKPWAHELVERARTALADDVAGDGDGH